MEGVIIVDSTVAGQRLDMVLAARIPDVSRSRLQQLIRTGQIRLNGKECRPSTKVRVNDRIEYSVTPAASIFVEPQDIELDIVYEDDAMMVINKPPDMVVHPGAGNPDGTVANALLFHMNAQPVPGDSPRPGIVHRLDKDTSGLLVLAKTDQSHAALSEAFARRQVTKTYIALCRGRGLKDRFSVENQLIRSSANRLKFTGQRGQGRPALTFFALVTECQGASLVLARPKTGRTHQIRVHLAELGHPIIGDALYGGKTKAGKAARQALHAYKLSLSHPITGKKMTFTVLPPTDMTKLINSLCPEGWQALVEQIEREMEN